VRTRDGALRCRFRRLNAQIHFSLAWRRDNESPLRDFLKIFGLQKPKKGGLAQKAAEVFLFPAAGTQITWKLAFATIELFGMYPTAAAWQRLIGYDRMQHLVIKQIPQEPWRHKRLIERRIDSDNAIFFLDRTKDEIFSRTMLSPATPRDFVTAKAPPKIPFV
jgi:hypothetical protein